MKMFLFHGTKGRYIESIQKHGLKPPEIRTNTFYNREEFMTYLINGGKARYTGLIGEKLKPSDIKTTTFYSKYVTKSIDDGNTLSLEKITKYGPKHPLSNTYYLKETESDTCHLWEEVNGPGPAVFLSNLPRSGPASDPLGYSIDKKNNDGYMVVVECDQSYLEERLFGIWTSIDVDTFLGFGKFRESSRVGDLEDFFSRKLTHPTVDCQYLTTGIDADKIFDIFQIYDGRQKRLLPEFNPKFHHRLSWKRKNFATLVWKRVLKLKKERSRRQR